MRNVDLAPRQQAFHLALAVSCALHLLILFAPRHEPTTPAAPARPEARLATHPAPAEASPSPTTAPSAPSRQSATRSRRMTSQAARVAPSPSWTTAQKAEMDGFLNELTNQARRSPPPSLAQRSLTMAREHGRQIAAHDAAGEVLLERKPNSPEPDPFSLEMYLEGMIRRLNRSAALVRNDPRSRGVHPAAVQFRLNPDGSLKSFVVLNAGDQADEIAFVKATVERSAPFSPFPPDIDRAARSLGVTICIRPGTGEGGMGFSQMSGNRCR